MGVAIVSFHLISSIRALSARIFNARRARTLPQQAVHKTKIRKSNQTRHLANFTTANLLQMLQSRRTRSTHNLPRKTKP